MALIVDEDVHVHNRSYYKTCCVCGFYFKTKKSHLDRRKTCSKDCDGFRKQSIYSGESNPNFGNRGELNPLHKGGTITNYGYLLIIKHDHPNADKRGYIFAHRFVMSEHLGRALRSDEHIHHKDHNKLNNDISNLEITTLADHSRHHALQRSQPRCLLSGVFIPKEDVK